MALTFSVSSPRVYVDWKKLTSPEPEIAYYNGRTLARIKNVQNNDRYEGEYECTGTQNSTGAFAKGRVRLSVLQKPKFIVGPENTNVTDGGSVTFLCRAAAEPPATITWLVNDVPIGE